MGDYSGDLTGKVAVAWFAVAEGNDATAPGEEIGPCTSDTWGNILAYVSRWNKAREKHTNSKRCHRTESGHHYSPHGGGCRMAGSRKMRRGGGE